MQIISFVLFFLLAGVAAVPLRLADDPGLNPKYDVAFEGKLNNFLDQMQPRVTEFIIQSNLDPLPLEDATHIFWVIPPVIPVIQHKVTLALTSGTLNNLSTVNRNGNALVKYQNKILDFDAKLGFHNVFASYQFYAKLLILDHYGYLEATANSAHAHLKLKFDFDNYIITLKEFSLDKIDSVTVIISGNVIYRWLLTPIANLIMPLYKNALGRAIEGKIAELAENYIAEINLKLRTDNRSELFHPVNNQGKSN